MTVLHSKIVVQCDRCGEKLPTGADTESDALDDATHRMWSTWWLRDSVNGANSEFHLCPPCGDAVREDIAAHRDKAEA